MNNEKLNFSFKSSFFTWKNPSKVEIEGEKINIISPNAKFGILENGNKNFNIEKNNIFSMKFSFISNIVYIITSLVIALTLGISLFDKIYYQEEYGMYATLGVILGFFGGNYIYEKMIKPKKKLEEITLSVEFLIKGISLLISIILLLIAFFKVGFIAIFIGITFTVVIFLFLLACSLQFQVVDKKGKVFSFPVLFWQFNDVNRIFQANFEEFYRKKEIQTSTNYQNSDENISQNTENHYISQRNMRQSNKKLLLGLVSTSFVTTVISYFISLHPTESDVTLYNTVAKLYHTYDSSDILLIGLTLPIISLIIVFILTLLKRLQGGAKIVANIFAGIIGVTTFILAFFPIYYINMFNGKMSKSQVETLSSQLTFGLSGIMLLIATVCIGIYLFQINKQK